MSSLPVLPRESARRDIDDAVAFYLQQDAPDAALRLVDELERGFLMLAEHPRIGSNRWAEELDLPGLRSWSLGHFPFVIFYVDRGDHVDVWRVLHGSRDLPEVLGDERP
ncbi:MAG: type II toxin-antitoxin system RelE/ParE family toxin [Actinomycetales bacterium]|nr:type II toxin-antitoxin system RelE/ParE family toxin [Actinomycetales bacterium]